jgi:hypothetical protein
MTSCVKLTSSTSSSSPSHFDHLADLIGLTEQLGFELQLDLDAFDDDLSLLENSCCLP